MTAKELEQRINRVSADFSIGKQRIHAILKLKEQERGFRARGEVSASFSLLFIATYGSIHRGEFP